MQQRAIQIRHFKNVEFVAGDEHRDYLEAIDRALIEERAEHGQALRIGFAAN